MKEKRNKPPVFATKMAEIAANNLLNLDENELNRLPELSEGDVLELETILKERYELKFGRGEIQINISQLVRTEEFQSWLLTEILNAAMVKIKEA